MGPTSTAAPVCAAAGPGWGTWLKAEWRHGRGVTSGSGGKRSAVVSDVCRWQQHVVLAWMLRHMGERWLQRPVLQNRASWCHLDLVRPLPASVSVAGRRPAPSRRCRNRSTSKILWSLLPFSLGEAGPSSLLLTTAVSVWVEPWHSETTGWVKRPELHYAGRIHFIG